jgi:hypothetical protein
VKEEAHDFLEEDYVAQCFVEKEARGFLEKKNYAAYFDLMLSKVLRK